MDQKDNISNNPICQCRNSIKLSILEFINTHDKPILIEDITEIIFEKVKKDNRHIIIDDNFLKTYIRSIISDLVDSKLINMSSINLEYESIFYIKLDNDKLVTLLLKSEDQNLSGNKNLNSTEKINSTENNIIEDKSILNDSIVSNKEIVLKEIDKNKSTTEDKNKLVEELISLRNKLDKIKKENKTKKLHNEIHRYNEIKDIGQELLGYIASNTGKRIKELYEDLDISDDDK